MLYKQGESNVCLGHAELTEARMKLASKGMTIQDGSAVQAENDTSYIDSVRDAQQELDQQGKRMQAAASTEKQPAAAAAPEPLLTMPALEHVGDVDEGLNGLD